MHSSTCLGSMFGALHCFSNYDGSELWSAEIREGCLEIFLPVCGIQK